jgi:hypothetical protein
MEEEASLPVTPALAVEGAVCRALLLQPSLASHSRKHARSRRGIASSVPHRISSTFASALRPGELRARAMHQYVPPQRVAAAVGRILHLQRHLAQVVELDQRILVLVRLRLHGHTVCTCMPAHV